MSITLMADTSMESLITTPRKRNYEGEPVTHGLESANSATKPKSTDLTGRQPSPALSEATSDLTELTSTGLASPTPRRFDSDSASKSNTSSSAPIKKRKLTFAEKEVEKAVRQREREEKAKQKAAESARKEEEKRQKDEEKRKKEEEKEASKRAKELEKAEKKKIRDAEKQEKDAEKAKKEAEKKDKEFEKLKKEKSQLRIGSFFGRPAPQSTPPMTPDDVSSRASSRRSSIAAIDVSEPMLKVDVPRPTNPEFEKYIIPYFIHENTEVAPMNRFKAARTICIFGDKQSEKEVEVGMNDVQPLRTRFGPPRKRMRMIEPVKEIAERVQAAQINRVDLSSEYNPLAHVSYKILSFREDVRPPYTGTYTRRVEPAIVRRLSRKPTLRARTDMNYDYDSEAEWEEPAADDEELLDDEVSESEDGDEEMHDFLDDEDDQGKRRMFAAEMEPVSSGLCFQGEDYDSNGHNMDDYRMDVLHDCTKFPIDPYSTLHWSDDGRTISAKTKADTNSSAPSDNRIQNESTNKTMPPPRMPLAVVSPPNTLNGYLSPGNKVGPVQNEDIPVPSRQRGRNNPNKDIKMISEELMDAFKQAIDGSDLTKAGLIEVLKKQFPKCSKDAIKDTLGVIAVRVGKKESEKKWTLI